MAWLSRILAPVDFSPRCHGAAQYAEALARHFQSELILFHAVSPPLGLYAPPQALVYSTADEMTEDRLDQRENELDGYLADQCPGIPITRAVVRGDPAQEIVEYARDHNAGLIVMGTHGYTPFRRFLLGSVTANVLHDAGCPVWTGPHLEDAPSYEKIGFHRVVCAIDLAKGSREVVDWAGRFAREYGAELVIVHVLPGTLIQLGGVYFDPEWREQAAAVAREKIAKLLEELGLEAEVLVEIGDPPVTVNDVAARRRADLLVIGRGKESGLMGHLRDHAYAILRESSCPAATI
jgi:nucleotide-binding universal stress UspA family protein